MIPDSAQGQSTASRCGGGRGVEDSHGAEKGGAKTTREGKRELGGGGA